MKGLQVSERLWLGQRRREQVLDRGAKPAQAQAVVLGQAGDHAAQGSPCGGNAVAVHGSRAIDEQLERDAFARCAGRWLQRRHHHDRGRRVEGVVRPYEQRGTRFTRRHDHHDIAVQPGAWGEVHACRPVLAKACRESMRRTFRGGAGQGLTDRERQCQRVLGIETGQRHLLRLQAGPFGVAVARGDRGRN